MGRAGDDRDLLALLGVDERARWEEVRRAFRDAVRASHPDLVPGDPAAERRLKQLTAAWESINTPMKWAAFAARPAARGSGPGKTAADPTRGLVRVQRQRRGGTGLRRWGIELDGELVGTVANGEATTVEAEPGRHSMRVYYETYSSPPLGVQLHARQELALGCRQLTGVRVNLLTPKRALVLERIDAGRPVRR